MVGELTMQFHTTDGTSHFGMIPYVKNSLQLQKWQSKKILVYLFLFCSATFRLAMEIFLFECAHCMSIKKNGVVHLHCEGELPAILFYCQHILPLMEVAPLLDPRNL